MPATLLSIGFHNNLPALYPILEEASSATLTGGGGDSLPTPYVIQPISPGTSDLQGPAGTAHQETNFSGSSSTKSEYDLCW